MLNCKEASCLVSESQERPLNFGERWALRMHLWLCIGCSRFARQIHLLRKAMSFLNRCAETEMVDLDLSTEARERIRKALVKQHQTMR